MRPASFARAQVAADTPPAELARPARLALVAGPGRVDNGLLAALPAVDWQRWQPWLEPVALPLGHVLCEAGATPRHAWFPTTAIVSLMYVTEDGASTEVAAVGHEGVVGTALFMGGGSTRSRAVVRSAGRALRLPAWAIHDGFHGSPAVSGLLLRYTQALIAQMAQTAVCSRHHTIDQRLCRWLLLTLDRLTGSELRVTQELMAQALGVRREGVTEAALALQRADLIRYARGHLSVLDRPGLERRTCECYAVVRREYARLLPGRPRC